MDPSTLLGVDVLLFLAIGLLGGAHCIGMCGPLVTTYAARMDPDAGRTDGGTHGSGAADGRAARTDRDARGGHLTTYEVRQHALFNLGRTASYALIGTALGALGGAVLVTTATVTGAAGTVRGVVGLGVGLVVMAVGVRYVLGGATGGVHLPGLQRVTGWLTGHVDRLANGPGIVALGAVHGLLPCPILYPAYLYAFASGSALSGGIALAALGVGTMPAVFLYGTLIGSVDAVHRRRVHRLLGVAFLALGYVLFAHGLMAIGVHVPHPRLPFWNPLDAGMAGMSGHGGG
ncbi:sulfite exporter TauE/SafE family protein [Halorubrum sp. 48-1-W]|uniref:sulfite exporter TauE/SafE family protein n=1 Tax=Halorubrum sp. 48-1-W TaxID=2249761 RepID=UPI000DCE7DDD|nr:sulfite exporter TauE/SafE family protein [Halorubrum sp. 48-1-W]RAW46642.1 sulfite exporter TauE/SafE family protein [Halorubrum sp. 48-1-W]